MKKIVFIIVCFLSALSVKAQDVIVKKDGGTIVAKVLMVSKTDVRYKDFANQDGPTYAIEIGRIAAINYEDGTRDSFEVADSASVGRSDIVTQETATQFSNDAKLLQLDKELRAKKKGKTPKPKVEKAPKPKKEKKVLTSVDYTKRAKTMKKIAFFGGGALAIGGAVLTIIGDKETKEKYNPQYDAYYNVVGFDYDIVNARTLGTTTTIGLAMVGAGVGLGTFCLLKSSRYDKLAKGKVSVAAVLENEFNLKNGKRLSVGIDALSYNYSFKNTLGLGIRYNF